MSMHTVTATQNRARRLCHLLAGIIIGIVLLASEEVYSQDAIPPPNAQPVPGARDYFTIEGVEYAFRWCPPGTFMMGSPESEEHRRANETQHQVTLSKGFWLLETPVTQAMWESIMGDNPSRFKGAQLPVESVNWNECQEFIGKLNELDVAPSGFQFSLPTEAQWEYACRAGTTTAYSFGDTLTQEQANVTGSNVRQNVRQTSEIRKYPANAWGLYDMHGNVWEWCQDIFGDYPDGAVTDPTGATEGRDRVNRGGSFGSTAAFYRSAHRRNHFPMHRSNDFGFRLALLEKE